MGVPFLVAICPGRSLVVMALHCGGMLALHWRRLLLIPEIRKTCLVPVTVKTMTFNILFHIYKLFRLNTLEQVRH